MKTNKKCIVCANSWQSIYFVPRNWLTASYVQINIIYLKQISLISVFFLSYDISVSFILFNQSFTVDAARRIIDPAGVAKELQTRIEDRNTHTHTHSASHSAVRIMPLKENTPFTHKNLQLLTKLLQTLEFHSFTSGTRMTFSLRSERV